MCTTLNNEDVKSLHELDTYVNGDNDQPTTCPMCSCRTDYIEVAEDKEQHQCLGCGYEFFLDFE